MISNPNAPFFILAAVQRIYSVLPSLAGVETWKTIQPQVDAYLTTLITTQFFGQITQLRPDVDTDHFLNFDFYREPLADRFGLCQ